MLFHYTNLFFSFGIRENTCYIIKINNNLMKTTKRILFFLVLLPFCVAAQTDADSTMTITIDSVALKEKILIDSIRRNYHEEVDFIIHKIESTYVCGRRGMSDEEWDKRVKMIHDKVGSCNPKSLEYWCALRYIGLLINDGHFQFPDGGVYNRCGTFKKEDIIFPIRVKTWKDGSVYIVRDYTETIPKDAEIISVNGRLAKEMALLNRLLAPEEDLYAKEWINVYHEPEPQRWNNFTNFLFMEQIKPPYKIKYILPSSTQIDTVTIDGMQREAIFKIYKKSGDKRAAARAKGGDFFSKAIRYKKIDDDLAVLTINSFWGRNLIEILLFRKDWTYGRQIKRTMRKLYRDDVENLIIDVSLNPGGMADNLYKTLNYFTDEPIDASTRYTVTDDNRKITKIRAMNSVTKILGISKEDKKRLGAFIDSLPSGTSFTTDTLYKVQYTPNSPKQRYRGNVYLLTSNITFSAGQLFAQYFKEFKIGQVAGQPCGGYSVITGGNTDRATLPSYASFIPLEIPTTLNKKHLGINQYEYETVDLKIGRSFDEWLKDERNSLDKLIEIVKSKP